MTFGTKSFTDSKGITRQIKIEPGMVISTLDRGTKRNFVLVKSADGHAVAVELFAKGDRLHINQYNGLSCIYLDKQYSDNLGLDPSVCGGKIVSIMKGIGMHAENILF